MAVIHTGYRQAISTHYIGPTNFRGSRVKAQCEAGQITIEWDNALNVTNNHAAAATRLIDKLKWDGIWHMGSPNRGRGFVFVLEE